MYAGSYSARTALQAFALRVQVEWLVRILILTSMMLQLVLVVLGARRYLSSSGILRFMVWGAYISMDAVAISALGTMMHSDRREIYGIWAPMLLMHLGGPDAITAYSMADNELWLRHGFNMVYQVSMAVYVIYASSLKGYPLAAAILLLLVGSIKYGERTLALRHGNYLRIVISNLSISKYMEIKGVAEKWEYVVMGEDQLKKMIEQKQASSSRKGRGIEEELETSSVKEKGIKKDLETSSLKGRGIQKELETSSLKGKEIVTIEDVKNANINDRGYGLCLSYALFKMYKQRFGGWYSFQGEQLQTRAFWVGRTGKEAFSIVEMELKFMYDAVFSKYSNTRFAKWGMVVRFLNSTLLGAAGYLILGDRESRSQAQRTVTYVVISVSLVVEVFQLWRVIVSDWTRVQLICAYVVASSYRGNNIVGRCRSKVIKITMLVLDGVENVVGGKRYWSNQIPQHCLIETWLNSSPLMCKMAGFSPKPDSFIVNWYIKQRHTHQKHVEDDLKEFIFGILKEICSQKNSNEKCKENVYNFGKNLFQGESEILEVLESHGNLEEVILMWHIATTLYERQRELPRQNETNKELPGENETEKELLRQNETEKELSQQNETEKNASRSRILSRYCAYLLLSRPNLLPLRPEMARIVYMELVNQLLDTVTLGSILEKNPGDLSGCKYNLLRSGAKLAELLREKGEDERWELLAKYWGKLVIYMAVYNKAIFHAECVAAGGEFLSLVWVLLGHMGCGDQSDSAAIAMERTLSDREKELDAVKKILSDRENDLEAKERTLGDLRNELAAAKKISSGPEIEPA